MHYDIRILRGNNVKRVIPFIKELAAFQDLPGEIEPNAEALGLALSDGLRLIGFGAFSHAALLGYCLAYPIYSSNRTDWSLHLLDLYVDEPHRGSPVAGDLLNALAETCNDLKKSGQPGYDFITLDVLETNRRAIAFYFEKFGAIDVGSKITRDEQGQSLKWKCFQLSQAEIRKRIKI